MVVREIFGAYQIEVETGGYVTFDVQPTNSPHKHDYFEICLVLDGTGIYHHGDNSFPLRAGTVFLAEPGVVHEITSFETRDLFLYFVTLTIRRLDIRTEGRGDMILEAFARKHLVARDDNYVLAHYPPLLDRVENRNPATAELLKLFTLESILALASPVESEGKPEPYGDIDRVLSYIDRNLDHRISVEEIARYAGLSERTLRRRFQERLGKKVVDEINHRRMRRAAHRLLMGFSVAEVADYSGISDPAQFTRAFTRAFRISPKRFQQTYIPGSLAHSTRPPD